MQSKRLAAVGLTAGLLAGGAAGLVLNLPGGAGASTSPAIVAQDDGTTDTTTEATRPEPGDRLREMLQPLVDDGTLTADQVEAIVAQAQANRPEGPAGPGGPGGEEGRRGPRGGHGFGGEGLATAAEVIGISEEDLATALRDGQTLAEIADSNGVDPQAVIDALVAEAETRITTFVNEGPQHLGPPAEDAAS